MSVWSTLKRREHVVKEHIFIKITTIIESCRKKIVKFEVNYLSFLLPRNSISQHLTKSGAYGQTGTPKRRRRDQKGRW